MITEDTLLRDAEFFADCGPCPTPEECSELEELYCEFEADALTLAEEQEEHCVFLILLIKEFFYN